MKETESGVRVTEPTQRVTGVEPRVGMESRCPSQDSRHPSVMELCSDG